jgi:hypothetical protein
MQAERLDRAKWESEGMFVLGTISTAKGMT